jgi:hypothetical protein
MRFLTLGFSALCLIATLACGDDPIKPEDLVGRYEVVSANGGPLPNVLRASASCDELLVGGTLHLQSDGSYSLQLDLEEDCTRGGGGIQEDQRSFGGLYTLDGQGLTFTVDSGPTSADSFSGSTSTSSIDLIIATDLAATGSLALRLLRSS